MVDNQECIKRMKQIKQKFAGLEVPMVLSQILHDARVCTMPIGEPSSGKSTIGMSLKYPKGSPNWLSMDLDKISINHLLESYANQFDDKSKKRSLILANAHVDMIFDDIHALNKRSREMFYEDIPSWITKARVDKSEYNAIQGTISFDHCTIYVWIPCQFESYASLMQVLKFRDYIADRYVKLPLVIFENVKPTLEKIEFTEFKPIDNVTESTNYWFTCNVTLRNQFSYKEDNRYFLTAQAMIQTYAKIEQIEDITPRTEREFNDMFGFYLDVFARLTSKKDVLSPWLTDVGAMRTFFAICRHQDMTIEQLADHLGMQDKRHRQIENHLELLNERGLIEYKQNSPKQYNVTKYVQDYFDMVNSL